MPLFRSAGSQFGSQIILIGYCHSPDEFSGMLLEFPVLSNTFYAGEILEYHKYEDKKTNIVTQRISLPAPYLPHQSNAHAIAKNDIFHSLPAFPTIAIISLFSYIVVKVIEGLIGVHSSLFSFSANLQ